MQVLPPLREYKDRNIVTMNVNKALASYWSQFEHSTTPGTKPIPVPTHSVFKTMPIYGPSCALIPPPQQAIELVWAGQAANVLHMFTVCAEMTMPYFKSNFNPALSTIYWKLLTRPVHVDLTLGFDDPSWTLEQSAARHTQMLKERARGSFSLSRGSRSLPQPHQYPLLPDLNRTQPVFVDLSRPHDMLQPASPPQTPNPSLFEPSFALDEHGLLQAPTGRRFDAMTDFLFVKSPRVDDILNLLEYGVAFLRGSSFLGWDEVNKLIRFNVERIIHTLVHRHIANLDIVMIDRLVNCISIFALEREYTGQFDSIPPYLMMAYNIAIESGLHLIDPGNICRLIHMAIFFSEMPRDRELYVKNVLSTFSALLGITIRTSFSYVMGSTLTPETEPEASSMLFWKDVEKQLEHAELVLPHLDTAVDLASASTILFKCVFAVMRAELGPRLGHHDWPVQQACLMAKHLAALSDQNTMIAIGILVRFRIYARRSSVLFNLNGKQMLVSDYLAEQIRNIPTMPTVPIVPGEEPFHTDNSKIFESQIPTMPDEDVSNPDSPEGSSASFSTADSTHTSWHQPHSKTSPTDEPALSATPNTIQIDDNSSPFQKEGAVPDTAVVKKDSSYSKALIGY